MSVYKNFYLILLLLQLQYVCLTNRLLYAVTNLIVCEQTNIDTDYINEAELSQRHHATLYN